MAKTAFPLATSPIPSDAEWRAIAKYWLSTGVIKGAANKLAVIGDSTGMQVKVQPGEAYIEGTRFASDAIETLPISAADATNPRIDLVVLRLDTVAGTVDFAVLTGTAAASPTAPLPTQTTTRWELPLAQVAVAANATTIAAGNVTDLRAFAQVGAYQARASDNLLVNGGCEVWQRGTGPITAQSAYTADRWQINLGGTSTLSVSKDTANVDRGSGACAALTYTHNALSYFQQKLEDYQQLRGQRVAFTARVRASVASAVRLHVTDGIGTWYSGYHSGSGTYETLSVVAPIGATATQVTVALDLGASGTYYLDNAMLVTGAQPQDYQPLTPAEDLLRCQRHWQPIQTYHSAYNAVAANNSLIYHPFRAEFGGTPTVTGTFSGSNMTGGTIDSISPREVRLAVTPSAAGQVYWAFTGSAEWNP